MSTTEQAKAWRLANPDKVKANKARYRARNKERLREKEAARLKAWALANADRKKAYDAQWKRENPEAKKLHAQNRRARTVGTLTSGVIQRLLVLQKGLCACCRLPLGEDFQLDHIMPLALGGTNTDDNVQLLTARCNQQKNAKHPVDFMRARGFLL